MILIALVLVFVSAENANDWKKVNDVLETAIKNEIFPGCSALVATKEGILYEKYFGNFKYDSTSTKVNEESLYDLASVTKVLSTTTAIEQFYSRKELDLEDSIQKFFPSFKHKEIKIKNCLLHNAGFPPDPTPYWYYQKQFGCEQSQTEHPKLVFDCYKRVREAWENQELIYPTGSKYVYSDISMISLHLVIGHLSKQLGYIHKNELLEGCPVDSETCYYEAYMRKFVFSKLGLNNTFFDPSIQKKEKLGNCVPTWIDNYYRNEPIQGVVSDENSYAQGGVSGHAGLFSSLGDVYIILNEFMFDHKLIPKSVIDLFISVKNTTQSSRAYGWGTNYFKNTNCKAFSKKTYCHLGYTGTNVCNDPENEVITILLTNRCFPDKTGHLKDVNVVISDFNEKIAEILKIQ